MLLRNAMDTSGLILNFIFFYSYPSGLILEPGKIYKEVFTSQIHLSMASLESRREKGAFLHSHLQYDWSTHSSAQCILVILRIHIAICWLAMKCKIQRCTKQEGVRLDMHLNGKLYQWKVNFSSNVLLSRVVEILIHILPWWSYWLN